MPSWLQNAPNIRAKNGAHIVVSNGFGEAAARFGGPAPAVIVAPREIDLPIARVAEHGHQGIRPTPLLTVKEI